MPKASPATPAETNENLGTVAVITRTKDRPTLLARALRSLTQQTYSHWHLVIVNDGGAPEPVEKLITKYQTQLNGHITVIHHKTSKGMEAASNAGITAIDSDYVIIHDDDDSWHPEFLMQSVSTLHAAPKHVGGTVCFIEKIMEKLSGARVEEVSREDCRDWVNDLSLWAVAEQNRFPPISFLYRRSVFKTIGGMYDESLPVQGDWEFNLRFLQKFDIIRVPKTLAYYHHRVGGSGVYANTVNDGILKHQEHNEAIRNRYLRGDLSEKQAGIGFLINQARGDFELAQQVRRFYAQSQHVRNLEQNITALNATITQQKDALLQQEQHFTSELSAAENQQNTLESDNDRLRESLEAILNSRSWKWMRKAQRLIEKARKFKLLLKLSTWKKIISILRNEGVFGLHRRVCMALGASPDIDYSQWAQRFDRITETDKQQMARAISQFGLNPVISIVMPVYNVEAQYLSAAIASVKAQTYPHWELCIADDCSPAKHIKPLLEKAMAEDSRIKIAFRTENGHISAASNSALALASGEFIALMDHDDLLPPHALASIAHALNENPELDLLYSDEDKMDAKGMRYDPYFKPDWNPDLFLGQNMFSHLGVLRHSLVEKAGGFRTGYDGSQDYDLVLRCLEHSTPEKICHIPHILYHWRALPESTASSTEAKDYAFTAATKALKDAVKRRKLNAEIVPQYPYHRLQWKLPAQPPLISLIIPTRNGLHLVKTAVESILNHTDYPKFEILIVDNQSDDAATLAWFKEIATAEKRVRILPYDAPFNFSAINNFAASKAKGSIIGLINNDIEVKQGNGGWLREMASQVLRPEIGCVGAKLLYPDGTVQHGGIALGTGTAHEPVAAHLSLHLPSDAPGYFGRAMLTSRMMSVTAACLLVRKEVFSAVGGLDEQLSVAFNDVDFCLRVHEKGFHNLFTPFAVLTHHESASRGLDTTPEKHARLRGEVSYMRRRWAETLDNDPYYNPNLNHIQPDFSPAFPPKARKFWKR